MGYQFPVIATLRGLRRYYSRLTPVTGARRSDGLGQHDRTVRSTGCGNPSAETIRRGTDFPPHTPPFHMEYISQDRGFDIGQYPLQYGNLYTTHSQTKSAVDGKCRFVEPGSRNRPKTPHSESLWSSLRRDIERRTTRTPSPFANAERRRRRDPFRSPTRTAVGGSPPETKGWPRRDRILDEQSVVLAVFA